MTALPPCDSQWNDFLIRRYDAYAMAKYDILIGWLGDLKGRTVLVAGAGSGELACMIAGRGAAVTAFDLDEEIIALAREAATAAGVTIDTRIGTLETYEDGKRYDVVVATDVLEHISDDRSSARRLIDLAKPSGRIVVTVPAGRWLFGYHDTVLGHYRRYNKSTLVALFRPWLRIEQLRYYGLGLIPVALLYSRFLKRPYPTARVGAASHTSSLKGSIVRGFFELEKRIRPPAGTSLLMMGRTLRENERPD